MPMSGCAKKRAVPGLRWTLRRRSRRSARGWLVRQRFRTSPDCTQIRLADAQKRAPGPRACDTGKSRGTRVNQGRAMSADAGYLALIDRLTTVRPPVFVFGGYAEDALLAGRTTRPHGDVDVLVGRVDLAEHLERFAEWGFPSFEIYFEVVPGSPLVYHAASDGIELELGVYDELVPGRPSFVLPADEPADPGHAPQRLLHPSAGPYRRRLDPDDLAARALPDASGRHAHRCLRSPTAQGRSRAGPAPDKPLGGHAGGRARARVRSVPAVSGHTFATRCLERETRFELATCSLEGCRSAN